MSIKQGIHPDRPLITGVKLMLTGDKTGWNVKRDLLAEK